MPKPDVDVFLDRLAEDEAFRREVGEELQRRVDPLGAAVEVAGAAGFEFSEDELEEAIDRRYGERELDDAELDGVAGGAVSVGANMRSVVLRTSGGVTVAFPDVCKTPSPGGPVPIPYPNIGSSSDTSRGTKKTKI